MKKRRSYMAKRQKRISGVSMDKAGEYTKKAGEKFDIGISAIGRKIEEYLKEAEEKGIYSTAGLCLHLRITREMLGLWRFGYVCAADEEALEVSANEALAYCVAMGELHIQRYLEECAKPGTQTKNLKLLESAGAIGKRTEMRRKDGPPFDLGGLAKYSK